MATPAALRTLLAEDAITLLILWATTLDYDPVRCSVWPQQRPRDEWRRAKVVPLSPLLSLSLPSLSSHPLSLPLPLRQK